MSVQPPPSLAYQTQLLSEVDRTHLNVLAICYWVWGGMILLLSLFGLIYVAMGIAMVAGAFNSTATTQTGPPPDVFGWFFVVFGGLFVGIGQLTGWMNVVTGFSLKKDRRRMLCLITAGLNCLSVPIGTALGVFTFIVLSRPSVKAAFAANSPVAR